MGESIRALIALLIGFEETSDPPLGRCINKYVSSSNWLKPLDDVLREELRNVKKELISTISSYFKEVDEDREEREECLEALWKLGLLLCGRDKDYNYREGDYRGKVREYIGGSGLSYIKVRGKEESEIHIEDLVKFVLHPLLCIVGRDEEVSWEGAEGGILDSSEEVLHKKLGRYLGVLKSDKWINDILYLPFCGRLFECIICMDSFLERSKVDLNLIIQETHEHSLNLDDTCLGTLILISAFLTRMTDLYPFSSEEAGNLVEFLSNPYEGEISERKFHKKLSTLTESELDKFKWTKYIFPNIDAADFKVFADKLDELPNRIKEYISRGPCAPERLSERDLLRQLILLCAEISCSRKLLEYITLSYIAQDGIPVITSHKWSIKLREDSLSEEGLEEIREILNNELSVGVLHENKGKRERTYETDELDGLIYLDNTVIKRLASVFQSAELNLPLHTAIGVVEVTTRKGYGEKKDKLERLVRMLNELMDPTDRVFFGLLVIKADEINVSENEGTEEVRITDIRELMSSEGRLRVYRDILKILERKAEKDYSIITPIISPDINKNQ